jgi:hypothetical protein
MNGEKLGAEMSLRSDRLRAALERASPEEVRELISRDLGQPMAEEIVMAALDRGPKQEYAMALLDAGEDVAWKVGEVVGNMLREQVEGGISDPARVFRLLWVLEFVPLGAARAAVEAMCEPGTAMPSYVSDQLDKTARSFRLEF